MVNIPIQLKNEIRLIFGQTKLFQTLMAKRAGYSADSVIFKKKHKVDQISDLLRRANIEISSTPFAHWIDTKWYFANQWMVIGNMPPDYSLILENSLDDLLEGCSGSDKVSKQNKTLLLSVKCYAERALAAIEAQGGPYSRQQAAAFAHMLNGKTENLYEALQRILFWSSLFWQTGHKLVGLGRLDKILAPYYDGKDSQNLFYIQSFLSELNNYYEFKSAELPGDIGQIIILGGMEADGSYFCNELTELFITAVKELHISDPKLLLRVSKHTPPMLLGAAMACIATGVGSPLISNDETVIPCLKEFGYEEEDAYNYVTSACWEPVSYGNSLEQNNLANIEFARVFCETVADKAALSCTDFNSFFEFYLSRLKTHIDAVVKVTDAIQWEEDPLFTLFLKGDCRGKDIAEGGAKYNDYGLLSVGLGNAMDSLLNVKRAVFDTDTCSLAALQGAIAADNRDIFKKIPGGEMPMFGNADSLVMSLTDKVCACVNEVLASKQNPLGGKYKWGLSSPGYITEAKQTPMTFDGRTAGDPLAVHISAKKAVAYTELAAFAAGLPYCGTMANGNVLDLFVLPALLKGNTEKFVAYLRTCIDLGVFQLQMNVADSRTLKDAKLHPQNYPDLIVRVWGFSAYFVDLTEDYQDVLIRRAEECERVH